MKRRIKQIDEKLDLVRFEEGDKAFYCLVECGRTMVLGDTPAEARQRLAAITHGIAELEGTHITAEAVS